MTFEEITAQIQQFCDERDWRQFHNAKDLAIAISLESSELLEHFLWKNGEDVAQRAAERRDAIKHEVADIAIYLIELCLALDVDLPAAIREKMLLNADKYPVHLARGNSLKHNELGRT